MIRKYLHDLNIEEKRQFIDSFDIVLTDCDGVIWTNVSSRKFPDIGSATDALQENGKQIYYVSNNSIRNNEGYLQKFKELGINSKLENIIHPAVATVDYLKKIQFQGLIYIIGSAGFKKMLRDSGFDIIDGPYENFGDNFGKYMKLIYDRQPVKCVIIDSDFDCCVATLARAEIYLKDPNCLFIVGSTDMLLKVHENFTIIGPGAYYKLLETMSGKKATIIGKPGDALMEVCMDKFRIDDKSRVLFIGDMIEPDIEFGNKCEFQTLLVLSGGTSKEDLMARTIQNQIPKYYTDSFADFSKIYDEINVKNKL